MSTANCPKCGFPLAEGATECPACGIVVAKYLAPPPPSPSSPAAATNEDGSPASLHESPKDLRLTFSTLEALTAAHPWIRFIAIYSYAVMGTMVFGALIMMLSGKLAAEAWPLALMYLIYPAIGLPIMLPLGRSANALRDRHLLGASAAVEAFAVHQAVFWRRSGILTVIALVILGVALVLGLGIGVLRWLGR
jgi:hypothetical protein